ncbi:uncharacterized protein LOC131323488 isoform X2 [Rhododendron vialii]|uniref:uncharacterized protein LOC131323488 isoform X2 n=1 Tax=Rhododendron vialii TaxID=182163 RepID=UPI0026600C73|nr:uncharacterized protein LOC131323488 isoform X2 [Rhododendron vialii]
MAPKRISPSLPSPISIGNCEVVVDAKKFTSKLDENSLQITLSRYAKIRISVVEDKDKKSCNDLHNPGTEESCIGSGDFVLFNPKDVGCQSKSQLQEVLMIYAKELPAMNYAANTGKQSMFLERCVSNGKYCTLLLKSKSKEDSGEVVAAITYQIIPADTQYAEVPLTAVSSIYQRKGIGSLLYRELKKRLQSVGIRTIFCWGDKESEGFWVKQGFVSIGEVDSKGKARRLPIKADIRRALCFPGGSTLMVSHLNMGTSANPEELPKFCSSLRRTEHSLPSATVHNCTLGSKEVCSVPSEAVNQITAITEYSHPQGPVKDGFQVDGSGKKRVWESSCTSLKSKKVKGGYQVDCELDSLDFVSESHGISCDGPLAVVAPRDPFSNSFTEKTTEECQLNIFLQDHGNQEPVSRGKSFRIMLMNIANDAKKSTLSKIIEDLNGTVTSDGSLCTHVVTGKVRKTLNFCTALCSGAWIISPSWLKESFREGRFVDEMPFILKDEDYELKYRIELKYAVQRARERPQALLHGYNVCLAAHLQPPVGTLSAIIRSAGGNVIRGVDKLNQASKTIFLVCEEDMEEALSAVKKGIWTFSSDWFMNCIMKQELDLDAPQFAESL